MAARAWFSYFVAPIAVLTGVALAIALLWLAGLFALVPALVSAAPVAPRFGRRETDPRRGLG